MSRFYGFWLCLAVFDGMERHMLLEFKDCSLLQFLCLLSLVVQMVLFLFEVVLK